jgi:hypothetical protein
MTGGRHVIKEQGTKGSVDEVQRLKMLHLIRRDWFLSFFHLLGNIDIESSSRAKGHCHSLLLSVLFFLLISRIGVGYRNINFPLLGFSSSYISSSVIIQEKNSLDLPQFSKNALAVSL